MSVLSTTLHPLDRLAEAWHRLSGKLRITARRCVVDARGADVCLSEEEFSALGELSPATLRDIGAPEWVAERQAQLRSRDLDLLRL